MSRPNLFAFATSELSQDAFICWLLDWARPGLEVLDPALHKCARLFISRLLEKHGVTAPSEIRSVSVRRQVSNIDILCEINGEYIVLIEDKTSTKSHSGQLHRYLENVQALGIDRANIIPIYFKTYDQSCYRNVHKDGYKEFLRDDLIEVLQFGVEIGVKNAIFTDFYEHLCNISKRVEAYLTEPISSWSTSPLAWGGFYKAVQQSLGSGKWDYVANPSGGFMGFWWGFQGADFGKLYLQLEQTRLCVKIVVDAEDGAARRKIRSAVFNALQKQLGGIGERFVRPARFGSGKYMTLLVCDEYLKADAEGKVDLQATLAGLTRAEAALMSAELSC